MNALAATQIILIFSTLKNTCSESVNDSLQVFFYLFFILNKINNFDFLVFYKKADNEKTMLLFLKKGRNRWLVCCQRSIRSFGVHH